MNSETCPRDLSKINRAVHEEMKIMLLYSDLAAPEICVLNDYFITDQPMTQLHLSHGNKQWDFDLAGLFRQWYPVTARLATHSCFLAVTENAFQCEDIGRHNAWIRPSLCPGHILTEEMVVYFSGRIPTDMAIKTIRAGIRFWHSRHPSARQLHGKEYHLTLICAARLVTV